MTPLEKFQMTMTTPMKTQRYMDLLGGETWDSILDSWTTMTRVPQAVAARHNIETTNHPHRGLGR